MSLKLHNTRTQLVEPFIPQDANDVHLYTCGPTVYSELTIGNWVAYIAWDTLVRTLKYDGLTVHRVMNITDVGHLTSDNDDGEDKLEKGARRENKSAWQVAEMYSEKFLSGMEQLNMIAPQNIVRATDFIDEQLALVRTLKAKGFTYQIDDGIYFDTAKFPTYADFARLDVSAQQAGARVTYNQQKRNPSDFALWKFTPANEMRDMQWQTPPDILDTNSTQVMGFPGWHLECSAMAMNLLGNTLDIHTGGIDHIPVHHTNEIAQSEAATGVRFSNFWIHNNHLKVDGTKISKSLGNGYTLADLEMRGFSAMDFRMFVLQSHYQSESNFTFENLAGAQNRLKHWRNVAALRHQIHDTLTSDDTKNDEGISVLATSGAITEAMNDNLNTPEALKIIDEAFARIETAATSRIHQFGFSQLLETIDELLGLQLMLSTPDISDGQKQLILKRKNARDREDWQSSDQLREQLLDAGIIVLDTPTGTLWHFA